MYKISCLVLKSGCHASFFILFLNGKNDWQLFDFPSLCLLFLG